MLGSNYHSLHVSTSMCASLISFKPIQMYTVLEMGFWILTENFCATFRWRKISSIDIEDDHGIDIVVTLSLISLSEISRKCPTYE